MSKPRGSGPNDAEKKVLRGATVRIDGWRRDAGKSPQICLTIYVKTAPKDSMATNDTAPESSPAEDALSLEELDTLLAEATGTTPEAIKAGAEELEIAPLSEADVVDE